MCVPEVILSVLLLLYPHFLIHPLHYYPVEKKIPNKRSIKKEKILKQKSVWEYEDTSCEDGDNDHTKCDDESAVKVQLGEKVHNLVNEDIDDDATTVDSKTEEDKEKETKKNDKLAKVESEDKTKENKEVSIAILTIMEKERRRPKSGRG
jgi:hypothetical protein